MLLNSLTIAALVTLLAALLRTKVKRVKVYICSEIVATAAIGVAHFLWPDLGSRQYVVAYCLARPIDLTTAIWISQPRIGTYFSALCLGTIGYIGVSHVDTYAAISLIEGTAFTLAGISMALQPPTIPNSVLAVLWLLLAAYSFGYAMGWQLPAWQSLNQWWNTFIFALAFLLIAIFPDASKARKI